MANEDLQKRIALNPKIMMGKPVIRGTRIPVELVVHMVAQGISDAEILREYPRLHAENIRAALLYAAQVLAHEEVYPLSVPT
jgi:uncharacterized protein (DUF433 family)